MERGCLYEKTPIRPFGVEFLFQSCINVWWIQNNLMKLLSTKKEASLLPTDSSCTNCALGSNALQVPFTFTDRRHQS